jgi:hypothetical protein
MGLSGEDFMERVRTRLKLVELEFYDVECKKCIGTYLQKKRKCSRLNAWYFGCNKRERYLKESTKKANNKDFAEFLQTFKDRKNNDTFDKGEFID